MGISVALPESDSLSTVSRLNLNLEMLVFVREENRSTRRKTLGAGTRTNQQQTQPTYDVNSGNRTWATLVGGKCSHHCTIPVPQNHLKLFKVNYGFDSN